MEFLFDLLLTAFFSLLFAFLLSKLFSASTSGSVSSHGAADAISGEAQSTGEGRHEEVRVPRSREGEDLQEEKIIEVDKVVEKEDNRGFLVEEGRFELSESVGTGAAKEATYEGTEGSADEFLTHVEFEKEKVDHGLVQKDESFELETSIDSDKEKESCETEVDDGKEAQSSVLIYREDEGYVREVESSGEAVLEPKLIKDDRDNLVEVEGLIDKVPREVGVITEEGGHLKEELEFKIDTEVPVILQEEASPEAIVSVEFDTVKDIVHNLCQVEGPIGKIVTEDDVHPKELATPEAISVLAIESNEQNKGPEGIECGEHKEEKQEEMDNLFKDEGPASKLPVVVEVGDKEKETAFIEEEEWAWEGIERTDMEKQFAAAAGFATSAYGTDALSKLSNEVQLQLYGLHRIATDGPCYESHSLALRPSTRAKWYVQFLSLNAV